MEIYQVLTIAVAIGGVLIAAGGLIVSIISLRRSSATESQTLRLQEKQEELTDLQLKLHQSEVKNLEESTSVGEKRRSADIRVTLEGTARNSRFVIRNWGYGAAKDINLEVKPLRGNLSPLVKGDADEKLPIPQLAPGSDFSLLAALSFDTGSAFDVNWSWLDEDGTQRKESSRISL